MVMQSSILLPLARIALLAGAFTVILLGAALYYPPDSVEPWIEVPRFIRQTITDRIGHDVFSAIFPEQTTYDETSWMDRNAKTMHSLVGCMRAGTCSENQTKVVLLGSVNLVDTVRGHMQGEHIWGRSIFTALDELGYSYLFSQTNNEVVQQYRMFPTMVQAVILEPDAIQDCFKNPACLKSASNPNGIPFWMLFGFQWWPGDGGHPLGHAWMLSPEFYDNGEIYIGYSIEEACGRRRFVPTEERPNQAYILAKYARYFSSDASPWTREAFEVAAKSTDVNFVVGLKGAQDAAAEVLPPSTRNLGTLDQDGFYTAIGHSRALIGIGNPMLSPSPWDALCLGVPFINPALWYDPAEPYNTSKWSSQHDGIMKLGEPYVYTVLKGDVDAFTRALQKALDTPIPSRVVSSESTGEAADYLPRYVHPNMTTAAVRFRVADFLSQDWRTRAALELQAGRLANEDIYVL